MKTKIKILFILSAVNGTMAMAQPILQSKRHLPRIGDEIIKQQVEYKNPGRTGENVLWDFGQLQSINESYTLSCLKPQMLNDSTCAMGRDTAFVSDEDFGGRFVGMEHHTLYYYRFDGCRLWKQGHENSVNLLHYAPPLLDGFFPTHYGDTQTESYRAEGIYSSREAFKTEGEITVTADAFGRMILPSGDTLRNVLHTLNRQIIRSHVRNEAGDTVPVQSTLETGKWYVEGYRYPVFETVRNLAVEDSTETVRFATAFFYPPQEHLYLADDIENLAVLDSLANHPDNPWANLSYNFFPNPVKTLLNVEIYLPQAAVVRYQIRNTVGSVVLENNLGFFPKGLINFQINVSTLPVNNYILDIWLNEHLINGIILKRHS